MVTRQQKQLAFELNRLRSLSGLSGRALAALLGINQTAMLRIQRGARKPTAALTNTWLDAVGAGDEDRDRVLALLDAVHMETLPWAQALGKDGSYQGRAAEQERAATLIRAFQPTIIPGLLQTTDYIREVLPLAGVSGLEDHAAALAGRLQRQEILHEPGRAFRFLLTEAVLRGLNSPPLPGAQADRLVQLAGLPTVTLAVLPSEAPVVALPWHNFVIFDAELVVAELIHGPVEITEPDLVKLYEVLWDQLWAAAMTDDEARGLLARVADDYRKDST